MFFLLGIGTVMTMVITFFLSVVWIMLLQMIRIKVANDILKAKDRRTALLKNIIQNISYVKMRAWETFYSTRIYRLRDTEYHKLIMNAFIMSLIVFAAWFTRGIALYAVLFYKSFVNTSNFGYDQISVFQRLYDIISNVMLALPWSVSYFIELNVSIKRISSFLSSETLDLAWVNKSEVGNVNPTVMSSVVQEYKTSEDHPSYDPNYAIILENGNFNWVNRINVDTAKTTKIKINKKK